MMERLNDIMGRAMQRRPAGSATHSSDTPQPTQPATYSYNDQYPQQRSQAERPLRTLPEQTGRGGYTGRTGYTGNPNSSRPTGRAEASERLGRVPASQPPLSPSRVPGEHPAIRPASTSDARTAYPTHPHYTRPLTQSYTEHTGNAARAYQPERTPAPLQPSESYHPLKTRPIAVQRHVEDYTVSPRVRADAIDSWEDDDRATNIQYGDWEDDEQEIVVYQRATTAYYEPDNQPVQSPKQQKPTYGQPYPQHPMVTRNLREVQVQEVTSPSVSRSAGESYHRMTQPLDPRVARHVGSIERDESSYANDYNHYRQTHDNVAPPMPPSPPTQHRPMRSLRQVPSQQPQEVIPYVRPATPVSPTAYSSSSPAPMAQTAKRVCPKCHGAGYLRADVPFGHPNFGKPIACECKETERKEKRRQQLRDMSNMDAFRDSNFRTFNSRVPGVGEAFQVTRQFSQDPDGWLLLVGPNGCGKTHLAAAIANQSLDSGSVVLFAVVPDLLDHLRAAFAPTAKEVYDQLFSKMREAELLVLDDLGSQQSSPWANEKLFQLLNYRYNMGMPTVITANPKGLQGVDERIRSRLTDISLVTMVVMDRAKDYRPNHPRRDV